MAINMLVTIQRYEKLIGIPPFQQ